MMIDGVTIATPTELKVGVFRLTKSERTASGKMMMEIIAVKRRLDCKWALIKDTDLKQIMDVLDARVFHTVVYPDPQTGETATIIAYVGDINMNAFRRIGNSRYYVDVSLSLIEQ